MTTTTEKERGLGGWDGRRRSDSAARHQQAAKHACADAASWHRPAPPLLLERSASFLARAPKPKGHHATRPSQFAPSSYQATTRHSSSHTLRRLATDSIVAASLPSRFYIWSFPPASKALALCFLALCVARSRCQPQERRQAEVWFICLFCTFRRLVT